MARGELRIYLGATSGVGKTYAMLDEAHRRRERGADVLVGCVDTHGRPYTVAQLRLLCDDEHPPIDLDLAAVLERHPAVVVVDDLAGPASPDSAHDHRWQDVEEILDHGIDVITSLDVEHIESLADSVERITGTVPAAMVPDEFLVRADQIQVVDITPEAIRRRLAHGNVYGPEELDPATADKLSGPSFPQLRALLLSWMSDRLTTGPGGHLDSREARECVVVAVSGDTSADADAVVRRAARLAQRSRARLIAVSIRRGRTRADGGACIAPERADLVRDLGGSYYEIVGRDPAASLVEFAEAHGATQLVLGNSAPTWFGRLRRASTVDRVIRRAGRIDVHVISHPGDRTNRHLPLSSVTDPALGRRRQVAGLIAAFLAITVATIALVSIRGTIGEASALGVYLLIVVAVSAIGGLAPGLAAAIASPLIANWYLIAPYHTLRVNDRGNVVELAVFITVAVAVSSFVSFSARRSFEAIHARREATILAGLAEPAGSDPVTRILEHLRSSFELDGVTLWLHEAPTDPWAIVASSGHVPPQQPDDATFVELVDRTITLGISGPPFTADDHRVLRSFVQRLAAALDQQRLTEAAARAEALDQADELRTAMLRAVSHDLRTPLAGIKASVSSLRQDDVEWPDDVRDEFLEAIENDTDRLTAIVSNLLDLSRLQAGVLRPSIRRVALEEVVPAALHSLGTCIDTIRLELPDDLDDVEADPALLERVVANLVGNALTWSPPDSVVRVVAHRRGDTVQLHIVDHGPGIRPKDREQVLQPFHRLGDQSAQPGLGLGLAIADRLTNAMGGRLELRDTPRGGLTAVITLPCSLDGST